MTSNPILPDFFNSEIYDTQVELGSCWDAPCRAAIAFSKCTSSLVLKSLLQEKLFWTSTTKKRQWNSLIIWTGQHWQIRPQQFLKCASYVLEKLSFTAPWKGIYAMTHRHTAAEWGSRAASRHLKSKKACPIKVICRMASLFVGLMNHHRL